MSDSKELNIFSKVPRQVGDQIPIANRHTGERFTGTVICDYKDFSHNLRDYYRVKVTPKQEA